MRAVVVYESMYGNTRLIAEAIADGLRPEVEVVVVPVGRAPRELLEGADLVVVGGPTHAHGISRANTRHAAVEMARKPGSGLRLDPDAEGTGLRYWLSSLGHLTARAAAFDTRVQGPAVLTGRASRGISKELRQHGLRVVAEPVSFFVTRDNHLQPGEEDRARRWGEQLAPENAVV
jgi:hypothetical protein